MAKHGNFQFFSHLCLLLFLQFRTNTPVLQCETGVLGNLMKQQSTPGKLSHKEHIRAIFFSASHPSRTLVSQESRLYKFDPGGGKDPLKESTFITTPPADAGGPIFPQLSSVCSPRHIGPKNPYSAGKQGKISVYSMF